MVPHVPALLIIFYLKYFKTNPTDLISPVEASVLPADRAFLIGKTAVLTHLPEQGCEEMVSAE